MTSTPGPLRLPSPCLVVLAGPPAAGKSTWAATHLPAAATVSADRLRAVLGSGEDDVAASTDAFVLLEEIVSRRVARGLTTVVDTTGTDPPGVHAGGSWPAPAEWRASPSSSTRPRRSAGPATGSGRTRCPPPR